MKTRILLLIIVATIISGCKSKHNVDSEVNRRVNFKRTNTYEVEYDFQTGKFRRNNNQLKVDNPVVFKIDNINSLAYDVKIKCKDSILASSFTDIWPNLISEKEGSPASEQNNSSVVNVTQKKENVHFSSNDVSDKVTATENNQTKSKQLKEEVVREVESISKLEMFIKQQIDIEKALESSKKELDTLQRKIQEAEHVKVTINQEINEIDRKIKQLENEINLEKDNEKKEKLYSSRDDLKKSKQEQVQKLEKSDYDIKLATKKIVNLNIQKLETNYKETVDNVKKYSDIKNDYLKKFANDSEKFIKTYGSIEDIYNKSLKLIAYQKETMDISQNPRLTFPLYDSIYKIKLQEIFSKLDGLEVDVRAFEHNYNELQKLYSYAKYNPSLDDVLNDVGQTKLYAYIDDLKLISDKMNENFKVNDFEQMITYLKQVIPLLEKKETYSIVSSSIQPMNDVAVFEIDIKKRNNKSIGELYQERKFRHKEFTYGGTRFDLGIGLSGAWFPNVKVFEFESRNIEEKDNSGNIIKSAPGAFIYLKSNQLYSPSLVGMFTLSHRSTHYITFGASAGMGVEFKQDKLQLNSFFVGPSVILGKYDRIVITAGILMKEVDILKKGYEIGEAYESKNNGVDFLTKEYRAGGFLSLTYNLTKGVRDNVKYLRALTK
ncbi:MAG: hypothetical protein AB7E26_13780 [Chryseobacterium sp.]